MDFLKAHKTSVGILVAVILAFVVYGFFFGGGSDSEVLVSDALAAPPVGGDLIGLLTTLQSLSLDESVFDEPIFRGLVDFNVELTPEPAGRANPFAPLGA